MDYLQYSNAWDVSKKRNNVVLNLIINGLPSILITL